MVRFSPNALNIKANLRVIETRTSNVSPPFDLITGGGKGKKNDEREKWKKIGRDSAGRMMKWEEKESKMGREGLVHDRCFKRVPS